MSNSPRRSAPAASRTRARAISRASSFRALPFFASLGGMVAALGIAVALAAAMNHLPPL